MQKRDGPPLKFAMFGGGTPAVNKKCDLKKKLSHFRIMKFVKTSVSSVIFQMLMQLHRGRSLVVQLYSNFSMDPMIFTLHCC